MNNIEAILEVCRRNFPSNTFKIVGPEPLGYTETYYLEINNSKKWAVPWTVPYMNETTRIWSNKQMINFWQKSLERDFDGLIDLQKLLIVI